MPKISVIVPVYKVEAYLRRCVDSILSQSFGDFELILVDDGSPDACPEICDEYEDTDPRVHVIHRKNGGLSAARNSGIEWAMNNSDSQWLTFVDSDDWLHRDCLKILLGGVRENVKISACGFERVQSMTEDRPVESPAPEFLTSEQAYVRYYGMFMTACCKLVWKELYRYLRFPEGKLHEDCYVTHLLTFSAENVAVLDVNLYYYYYNPTSITRSRWNPRRLDELTAHEQRLAYLQVRGYEQAYRREAEVYIMTVYEQTEALALICDKNKTGRPHLKRLRRKLREAMKLGRELGLYPREREYFWMYLMVDTPWQVWLFGQKAHAVLKDRKNR